MSDERSELALELRRHLAWLEKTGARVVLDVPQAKRAPAPVAAPPVAARGVQRPPVSAPPAPVAAPASTPLPIASSGRTLDEVRRELGDCRRCKLHTGRTNIVFGVGNPKAELVFVGEGPGAEEDRQGVPFVGAAGQLLTKMIEAMKFRRDDVYICNVVKCRPPNNRAPEPDEVAACEPFLKAQLAAIAPKVIVALGKVATHALLRETTPITRLRGQWRSYEGIPLMPTFHPAYLLRQPGEKRLAWADLQAVMQRLGRTP